MTKSFPFPRLKLPRFRAISAHVPTLTGAEKTALVALALTLGGGGALRGWERAGVVIGPVDDWASLRALVIRAREASPETPGTPTRESDYPCLDEPATGGFGSRRGGGAARGGMDEGLVAAGMFAPGNAKAEKREGASGKKRPARAVDLNTAGERALLTLPGVGPSTARAIIAHRATQGRFRSVDDLMQVKGIGPKKLEALRPYAKVEAMVEPRGDPKIGAPPPADTAAR